MTFAPSDARAPLNLTQHHAQMTFISLAPSDLLFRAVHKFAENLGKLHSLKMKVMWAALGPHFTPLGPHLSPTSHRLGFTSSESPHRCPLEAIGIPEAGGHWNSRNEGGHWNSRGGEGHWFR